ncbi:hypothetical protein CPAR01_15362 [Colletotrichum paranaense]|uniref:Uncharacterized protein n=2 Tax=Colletotrichum acutatum species complex TaxID=2707335 RepID=A0ABQ9P8U0_9PEZI|nr:uncharacterized protein CPAR01_15362 [Colletotrichum paranaense]KAK0368316.1 hypothetical protein CLIM01_14326 [Colletotrichum limetticola]KAK1519869.1 hypothetical protein CPAR01_15362 [Colletotrichum paranaense]
MAGSGYWYRLRWGERGGLVGCGPGNMCSPIRPPAQSLGDHRYMPILIRFPASHDDNVQVLCPNPEHPLHPHISRPLTCLSVLHHHSRLPLSDVSQVSLLPGYGPAVLYHRHQVSVGNGNATGGPFTSRGIVNFLFSVNGPWETPLPLPLGWFCSVNPSLQD